MSVFNINFKKLASDLLPHFLRDEQLVALFKHPLSAVKKVNDDLVTTRDSIAFDLSFTGQKIYLQELLNLTFDPAGRAIYIENQTDFLADNFTFNEIEGRGLGFINYDAEATSPDFHALQEEYTVPVAFLVYVPSALVFDQDEMEATINKYRAAGKSFAIQLY
jgi:hypothetical protein